MRKEVSAFLREHRTSNKGTQFKIRNSIGVYNIYKWMQKHRWYDIGHPVTEHDYYAIIRGVNDLLAQEIADGKVISFPSRMGRLVLRKWKCGAYLHKGKLKITYPIDWERTWELWYDDKEAFKSKTVLRREVPHIYYVHYEKRRAIYENKIFYDFTLNHFIKRKLKENINAGKIDTIW